MTGQELRAAREARGLSTGQFADLAGMNQFGFRLIGDYESGRYPVPKYIIKMINEIPVPDCKWCGGSPVRMTFDDEPLCANCCDKWVQGERE